MRLPIGLERYVLVNFIMNCIVIGVIARFRGRNRWGLTLFAAAFGALYAVAMQYPMFYQLRWWPSRCADRLCWPRSPFGRTGHRRPGAQPLLLLSGAAFMSVRSTSRRDFPEDRSGPFHRRFLGYNRHAGLYPRSRAPHGKREMMLQD
jgi:hypothetical protein